MTHTKEPWAYRPEKHDDWGVIRAPVTEQGQWLGGVICQARDPDRLGESELAACRAAKTDPWEANARRIVDCVNALANIPDPAAFVAAFEGMVEAASKAIVILEVILDDEDVALSRPDHLTAWDVVADLRHAFTQAQDARAARATEGGAA